MKLSAFVAITLAWLVLSVAAGVLWARGRATPEIEATSLAGPP